uniref:Membrane-spanning 4-domains subfamily A member 4A n=2 Tax=Cyprinus carpio TaxID=7962 RepID=A0A9J8B5R4_CYPCA
MSMTTALNNVNHLEKFLKTQPKALGAVQIMTGVLTVSLGIIKGFSFSFAVATGIMYWGSIIFIVAGSLSIAAENKLHECMVKASLGGNVVSAITSGMAILVFAADVPYTLYGQNGSAYNCFQCVYDLLGVDLSLNQQFYSLPVPLTNQSCTVDYVNMNMTSVVNGHGERDLPPIPRDTTNQKNENEYEQPTYNKIPDM